MSTDEIVSRTRLLDNEIKVIAELPSAIYLFILSVDSCSIQINFSDIFILLDNEVRYHAHHT